MQIKYNKRIVHKYLGAVHIHSKYSDGTGGIEELSLAAKKAGLDFIIVTDHNKFDISEGIYNGVCIIKGEEISPYYQNHYIALNTNKHIDCEQEPKSFIKEVRENGGFGFAAHPFEGLNRKNKHKPIKWLDKNNIPDGVEIWNWFSTWADKYCDKNIFTVAYAYLFRHQLVNSASKEAINWWDELNNQNSNIVPAIGGVDAHALKIKDYIIPLTIFPYVEMFTTITNVISLNEQLSKDFKTAKEQILSSIKHGQNIIINRKICNKIPDFYITNNEATALCGESVNFDNNGILNLTLPKMFEIKLICNGIVIYDTKTNSLKIPLTKKGKYRVEISNNATSFAYTNPILVT